MAIAAIAGAALAVGGSIFGGITGSRARKKLKRQLEADEQRNKDWFNRKMNEDATQRADAQRMLTKTEETFRNRNRAAQGTAAVMGGTEESISAVQDANAQAYADAASQITAAGEARKEAAEETYWENGQKIQSSLNGMENQKAMDTAQAVQGVAQAGAGLASALSSSSYKSKM